MANDIFNYCVATNTGKGFITHADSRKFWLQGYHANVWVATDCVESRHWVARNNGVSKTKSEAQALITAEVEAGQAAWDSDSRDANVAAPEGKGPRPPNITLP
tara:strand:- start:1285 stop:1593 length:309 start_codon:yes stop_codon:yes gene_type:complete